MADNSAPERARGPGKPFQKGRSGNPGGRPKSHSEFISSLRGEGAGDAKEQLEKCAKAGEPWAVQLLLAYAWGKPTDAKLELAQVSDEELEAELERRVQVRQRAAAPEGPAGTAAQH